MLRWSCRSVFNALKVLSTNHSQRWNHYKSLGLTPSATLAEVKAAYYKLSKIYHPDRNNGSEASAKKFRDIVAAYEVLSKTDSRKEYDREITRRYEGRKSDLSSKKKPNNRIKKSSNSSKTKSHFKSDINSKSKQNSVSKGRKEIRRYKQEHLENLIARAIPLSSHNVLSKLQMTKTDSRNPENCDEINDLKNLNKYSHPNNNSAAELLSNSISQNFRNVDKLNASNANWRDIEIDISKIGNHYFKLSKYRLTSLVVMTSMIGYAMSPFPFDLISFLSCTAGTALVSSAANSINQFLEVPFDAQMSRTRNRVLVQGHLTPLHAIGFAAGCGALGLLILCFGANALTASLGASNLILYTIIYTPLKRISILNTWIGSIVGAIPPLMGWAACQGSLGAGAFILGGILYAWQFPHFNALSWNLRPDYSKAGYRMMAVTNPGLCRRTALRYTVGIALCSSLAPIFNLTYWTFAVLSVPINVYFVYLALKFFKDPDSKNSRKLFRFSLLHLPLLMGLMLITKQGLISFNKSENREKEISVFHQNEDSSVLIKNISSSPETKQYAGSQIFHTPL